MASERKFPIFRKYLNERTFFKVLSMEAFVQVDIIGDGYMLHTFHAKVHPDRVLIMDMIEMANDAWQESSEEEFEKQLAYCRKNLRSIG